MEKSKKSSNVKLIILLVIIVLLCVAPAFADTGIISILTLIFIYMAFSQMWNLLAGFSGLVSLGQQIFIGLGGYALAVVSQKLDMPILIGILTGGVISVIFAWIISKPVFRMKGVFFTIGTWVIAETLLIIFGIWQYVGAGVGMNISKAYSVSFNSLYYISLVLGLASIFVVYLLLRSKFGLSLMAIRDNESAAETNAIELYKTKLICFLISAFVTGIAGGVMYLQLSFIQSSAAFGINWTVAIVFIVVIGGIGTIEGPIIGAVFYIIITQFLYNYPGFGMLILGVIAIAVIILAPKGIMGFINSKGIEIISIRRRFRNLTKTKATKI